MVKIEQSLCIGCAKCVKDCVSGVLHIDQGKAAVRENCMPVSYTHLDVYKRQTVMRS